MLHRIKFRGRLALLFMVAFLSLALVGATGVLGGRELARSVAAVYGERVVPMGHLAQVLDNVHRIRAQTAAIVQSESRLTLDRLAPAIAAADAQVDALWRNYRDGALGSAEARLAQEFEAALADFRRSNRSVLALAAAGDSFSARESLEDTAAYDRAVGDLRKLTDLQISLAGGKFDHAMEVWRTARAAGLVVILGGLAVLAAVSLLVCRSILGPMRAIIAAMTRLADGDTSVEVPGVDRTDETGDIARAVRTFKDNAIEREQLRQRQLDLERHASEERRLTRARMAEDFDRSVGGVVDTVSQGAARMEQAARSLAATARTAQDDAAAVGSAAGEASLNVERVAAATEELTASIAEIGRQVTESARIAAEAAGESRQSDAIIGDLAGAAARIGEIVDLITAIASQTNLLALNATIEAARAGDAGKGFAVVAGEVKNLATQTAKATEEIATQIAAVQAGTDRAVRAIRHTGEIITRMNGISGSVASAVEQQAAATNEIARSIEQAAAGTRAVTARIAGTVAAASAAGEASREVLGTAEDMSLGATTLRDAVESFLGQLRAV